MTRNGTQDAEDSFFRKVWQIAAQVPYGRVTTYGAIAEFLGSRGSARMVGWAMNASHTDLHQIPAHRVVNRAGVLTGKHHFGGSGLMQQLLESEGIRVENDRIVDFDKHYWKPSGALHISNLNEDDHRTDKTSPGPRHGSGSGKGSRDPEHDRGYRHHRK